MLRHDKPPKIIKSILNILHLAESCAELHPDQLLSCAKGDLYCTALAKRRNGLTTIDLQNCEGVTNDSLTAFMTHCPSLIHINLTGCKKVRLLFVLLSSGCTLTDPLNIHILLTGHGRYLGEADD